MYGIDANRPDTRRRPWQWFVRQVEGLINRPPVGFTVERVDEHRERLVPHYGTRIQQHYADLGRAASA